MFTLNESKKRKIYSLLCLFVVFLVSTAGNPGPDSILGAFKNAWVFGFAVGVFILVILIIIGVI